MKALLTTAILVSSLLLAGCIKEPEGPAERFGRSLDEMSKSIRDMGDEWDKDSQREREAREREARDREYRDRYGDPRDSQGSDYRGSRGSLDRDREIPDHDPYYDTPPSNEGQSDYERDRKDPTRRNDYRY